MKYILKILSLLAVVLYFTACDKADDLPLYGGGTAPMLSASALTIAPAPADSNSKVLTLSWTSPNYSADSAKNKYIIEIDSTGKNFANARTITVTGALQKDLIAKELNTILLSYGYTFNVPVDMDVRVVSSYANNNDRLISNTLKIRMTPYKIPPRVPLPIGGKLFITGDATDFLWTNPSPMPAIRQLTRLDETTWAGIFRMTGSGGFLLLPTEGNWDNKYSITNPQGVDAGDFGFNRPDNFSGNVTGGAGWYKLVFDFQQGKYTFTKMPEALSPDLWITGDATTSNWVNNPPAAQKFTMLSNGLFEITQSFIPAKAYKFLNTASAWSPQFGGSSATGGQLFANYGSGSDPAAIPTPATAGTYKIRVNFLNGTGNAVGTYTVTQ